MGAWLMLGALFAVDNCAGRKQSAHISIPGARHERRAHFDN